MARGGVETTKVEGPNLKVGSRRFFENCQELKVWEIQLTTYWSENEM